MVSVEQILNFLWKVKFRDVNFSMSDDKKKKSFFNPFNWKNSPENNKSGNSSAAEIIRTLRINYEKLLNTQNTTAREATSIKESFVKSNSNVRAKNGYKQLKKLLILKEKFIETHDELLGLEKSNNILSDHPYFKDNLHVQWIKFFDNIELKIKEHFASNNLKLDSEEENIETEHDEDDEIEPVLEEEQEQEEEEEEEEEDDSNEEEETPDEEDEEDNMDEELKKLNAIQLSNNICKTTIIPFKKNNVRNFLTSVNAAIKACGEARLADVLEYAKTRVDNDGKRALVVY